jgi:hypothetical protein
MSTVALLAEVASRVLEDTAFLFLDSIEEEPCSVGGALAATIAFTADQPQTLKLVASRPLLVEAAANMLGTEVDDPEAFCSAEQAVLELLNVVAGSLVARLYGTDRECALGIPEPAPPQPAAGDAVVVMFRADTGHFLRLELR